MWERAWVRGYEWVGSEHETTVPSPSLLLSGDPCWGRSALCVWNTSVRGPYCLSRWSGTSAMLEKLEVVSALSGSSIHQPVPRAVEDTCQINQGVSAHRITKI